MKLKTLFLCAAGFFIFARAWPFEPVSKSDSISIDPTVEKNAYWVALDSVIFKKGLNGELGVIEGVLSHIKLDENYERTQGRGASITRCSSKSSYCSKVDAELGSMAGKKFHFRVKAIQNPELSLVGCMKEAALNHKIYLQFASSSGIDQTFSKAVDGVISATIDNLGTCGPR